MKGLYSLLFMFHDWFLNMIRQKYNLSPASTPLVDATTLSVTQILTGDQVVKFDFSAQHMGLPSDKRLLTSEIFYPVMARIITRKTANGDIVSTEQMCTFPDPNVFDETGQAGALESIYQGQMAVSFNQVKVNKALDTNMFRYQPDATYLAAAASGNPQDVGAAYGNLEEKGFFFLFNKAVMEGQDENVITLTLGKGYGADMLDGDVAVTVELFGFRYSNNRIDASDGVCTVKAI